jgi:predicted nucleic acid-binding protein
VIVFADSSAVVKLYANEDGAEQVRALPTPLYVSALARVEVPAALWRKQRTGEMSIDDVTTLIERFTSDFYDTTEARHRLSSLAVSARIINRAADLLGKHVLRAYDAVQLATALTLRTSDPETGFACFDAQLITAGTAEGFHMLPQEEDTTDER